MLLAIKFYMTNHIPNSGTSQARHKRKHNRRSIRQLPVLILIDNTSLGLHYSFAAQDHLLIGNLYITDKSAKELRSQVTQAHPPVSKSRPLGEPLSASGWENRSQLGPGPAPDSPPAVPLTEPSAGSPLPTEALETASVPLCASASPCDLPLPSDRLSPPQGNPELGPGLWLGSESEGLGSEGSGSRTGTLGFESLGSETEGLGSPVGGLGSEEEAEGSPAGGLKGDPRKGPERGSLGDPGASLEGVSIRRAPRPFLGEFRKDGDCGADLSCRALFSSASCASTVNTHYFQGLSRKIVYHLKGLLQYQLIKKP